jgi:hypothetical protein
MATVERRRSQWGEEVDEELSMEERVAILKERGLKECH